MDQSTYREMEERRSIRDTSKNLKKYGSTSKHVIRNDNLIKHLINKTDTLAGIALKYGTTTEQIRRINRLWATDSLFLREYLLVPVANNATMTMSHQNNETDNVVDTDTYSVPSASSVSSNMNDDSSIDNFLARMDTSIATVKKDVQKTQGNSAFCREDDIFVQRRPRDRLRHSHPQSSPFFTTTPSTTTISSHAGPVKSSSEDDVHDLPSALVMTHGKKLKSSLQKLQQQQDEMFQL